MGTDIFRWHMPVSRICDFEEIMNELQVGFSHPPDKWTYGSSESNPHCCALCLSTCCVPRLSVDVGQLDVLAARQDWRGGRSQLSRTLLSCHEWRRLWSVGTSPLHFASSLISQFFSVIIPFYFKYAGANMGNWDTFSLFPFDWKLNYYMYKGWLLSLISLLKKVCVCVNPIKCPVCVHRGGEGES